MKEFRLAKLSISILGALALTSIHSYAGSLTNEQIQTLITKIVSQKTEHLQKEVKQLQGQVRTLKSKLNQQKSVTPVHFSGHKQSPGPLHVTFIPQSERTSVPHVVKGNTSKQAKQPSQPSKDYTSYINSFIKLGAVPVFTSQYIGEHSAFDGSDLVVNQSNVNFDVQLLRQSQAIRSTLVTKGLPFPKNPVIELSGEVEGIANLKKTKPGSTQADVNLAAASLDVYAKINPWVLGYLDFDWEDSFPNVYRVSRSNAYVNKAFITLGNFAYSPWYASLGQLYVPFGQYSSYMVSDSLTELLGRTQARSLVLGYRPRHGAGVFAAGYVFKSDTRENAKSSDGGVDLGYEWAKPNFGGSVAVGAIANIADSQGMQITPAPANIPFQGFGTSSNSENIFKAVPAIDVNGKLNLKHYTFIAEYIDSTRAFDPRALTFNSQGARVSAGHFEAAYKYTWHNRPGSFALSYGFTKDALGLFLPRDRYMATLNYSFWRDTLASLEFRHDTEYSTANSASGAMSEHFIANHKYVNLVTAQFAVFF